MQKSEKKVILITGGCQGLGKEIAKLLISSSEVIILSENPSSVEETGNELNCTSYVCDITDSSAVESTVSKIIEKFGKIDVLVNNAGVWVDGNLEDNTYNDIARVIFVNVVGTMNMTKAILPFMKKQKSGRIINIDSVDGLISKKDRSIYTASKWAITGFTKSLRKDLEEFNIGVFGIYPGLIKTSLFKNSKDGRDMTGAMDPVDVAKVIEFVITSDNIAIEDIMFRNLEYEMP